MNLIEKENKSVTDSEASRFAIDAEGLVGFQGVLSVGDLQPESIVIAYGDTWAIKITKEGIVSNPDVPTDEGAKAVFEALEPYMRNLRK